MPASVPFDPTATILVEVINPEQPFAGVIVEMPSDTVFVSFGRNGTGDTGDGGGGEPLPDDVVLKQPGYPTPATLNQVIACLQAAGLCA